MQNIQINCLLIRTLKEIFLGPKRKTSHPESFVFVLFFMCSLTFKQWLSNRELICQVNATQPNISKASSSEQILNSRITALFTNSDIDAVAKQHTQTVAHVQDFDTPADIINTGTHRNKLHEVLCMIPPRLLLYLAKHQ